MIYQKDEPNMFVKIPAKISFPHFMPDSRSRIGTMMSSVMPGYTVDEEE